MRVAADDGHKGVLAVGILHGANDVRRTSAGGQANQHIAVAEVKILQVHGALRFVIFHIFHGAENGFMAAGNHPDHLLRTGTESRRTFAGIQDPQAPGGPGANVNQASTGL